MKGLLMAALITCSFLLSAKVCSDPSFQGFAGEHTISVGQAVKVISSDLAATTDCGKFLKLHSGHLFVVGKESNVLVDLRFYAPFDVEQKKSIIKSLQPGVKLMFEELKYGEEKRFVPSVTFVIK